VLVNRVWLQEHGVVEISGRTFDALQFVSGMWTVTSRLVPRPASAFPLRSNGWIQWTTSHVPNITPAYLRNKFIFPLKPIQRASLTCSIPPPNPSQSITQSYFPTGTGDNPTSSREYCLCIPKVPWFLEATCYLDTGICLVVPSPLELKHTTVRWSRVSASFVWSGSLHRNIGLFTLSLSNAVLTLNRPLWCRWEGFFQSDSDWSTKNRLCLRER
jgi:hypothetical protein